MKKRAYFVIVFCIALILALVWFSLCQKWRPSISRDTSVDTIENATIEPAPAAPQAATDKRTIETAELRSPPTNQQEIAEIRAKLEAVLDKAKWEWRMPIAFYGKTVNELGEPVTGANIHFIWTDLSASGSSATDVISDGQGNFNLSGATGKLLQVWINKPGFYVLKTNQISFDYSGGYKSDPRRPEVFYLRKKGIGADLITSQYGVSPNFRVVAPLDGTSVAIDLLNRKVGGVGQLFVQQNKPEYTNWRQATQWSFKMEIPDGGFVEQHDEFPFEAPEGGYTPVVEFNFHAEQPGWNTALNKDFYIKFGSPPQYGRLHVDTSISINGARLTYAINPDGSRNLEPK